MCKEFLVFSSEITINASWICDNFYLQESGAVARYFGGWWSPLFGGIKKDFSL